MGGSGNSFDVSIVEAFLKKISPYPIGSCVKLSNGEIAIVLEQNDCHPLRPVVRPLKNPKSILDLYKEREFQNVVIDGVCNITTELL